MEKAGLIYNSNIEDKLFEKLVEYKNLNKKKFMKKNYWQKLIVLNLLCSIII